MATLGQDLERVLLDVARERSSTFWGKYRGTVEDVDDSAYDGKKLGRIQAKVPSVYGDKVVSPWAWPCVPYAGKSHGLVLLPEKGDGVWIEFEMGNPEHPIWTGCWWGDGDLPSDGSATKRALVTSKGLKLVLDEDAPSIRLVHPDGAEVTMTKNDITLKLGNGKVVISSGAVKVNDTALEVK